MSKQAYAEADVPRYVPLVGASRHLVLLGALAACAQFLPQDAGAQSGERSGTEVVNAVCSACHGTGANGAAK